MNVRDALIQQSPSIELQRAAADEIAKLDNDLTKLHVLKARLAEALVAAGASLKDLAEGLPQSELHEPVQMTVDRIDKLIPGWDQS